MENEEPKENRVLKIIWTLLFAMMYPILITFSLLFTGLLWFFSALSRLVSLIFKLFSKPTPPTPEPPPET